MEKKFYIIKNETDKSVGKTSCQTLPLPTNYDSSLLVGDNSMTKMRNDKAPECKPNLIWELDPKSKLTNVISVSNVVSKGFLMDSKTKKIFEEFNLGSHAFYEAQLIYEKKHLEYHWFHPIYFPIEKIDFSNSAFFVSSISYRKIKDIAINDYSDFIQKKKENLGKFIIPSKISLIKECDKELDVYIFPFSKSRIFVSNYLVDALYKKCTSGFKIIEQDIF